MSRVWAGYALNMNNISLFTAGFAADWAQVVQSPDITFPGSNFPAPGFPAVTYPQRVMVETSSSVGGLPATIMFGGSGFTQSSSGDFTGGTVTGILGMIDTGGGALNVFAAIQGVSVDATVLQTVAATPGTADDVALVRLMFSRSDYFALSNQADVARAYGGTDSILGNGGTDTLYGGTGNDHISGGSGNDVLHGDAGNDRLVADTGRDILIGNMGKDLLVGGTDSGRDVFIFGTRFESALTAGVNSLAMIDTIQNFTRGAFSGDGNGDRIDLSLIDADIRVSASGNQTFKWGGSTPNASSIWLVDSGANVIVMGDVNGNLGADFAIRVTNVTTLSDWDFVR